MKMVVKWPRLSETDMDWSSRPGWDPTTLEALCSDRGSCGRWWRLRKSILGVSVACFFCKQIRLSGSSTAKNFVCVTNCFYDYDYEKLVVERKACKSFVECTDFIDTRNKYFDASSLTSSKKPIFITSFDVAKLFYSSYVALILSCFKCCL